MKNLLMKLQNKRNEKKGFTLVELLVVIAILAILASVSVVGYLGFTQKAKNSNAATELAQVREVLRAELLDGKNDEYAFADDKLYLLTADETAPTLKSDDFKADFSDLNTDELGIFTITVAPTKETTTLKEGKVTWAVTKILYSHNGGTATWVMGNAIEAGTK